MTTSPRATAPSAPRPGGPHPWLQRERFADLPYGYRMMVVLSVGLAILGSALVAAHVNPLLAAIIAAATFLAYGFGPVVPSPSGGIFTFDMPTRYSVALLFDPATVLIGVPTGIGMSGWLVHKREPWRAAFNAAYSLNTVIAAVAVRWLVAHMGLTFAMVAAPAVVVIVGHQVNDVLTAASGYFRYGVAMWPEYKARVVENMGDQALDVMFLLPIAVGAVLLRPQWWPALVLVSLLMSRLNAWCMLYQLARFGEGRTAVASHALPSDDPVLRRVVEDLGQGVGFLTAAGVLLGMTVAGSHAFGREQPPAGVQLVDLCSPLDAPAVARAIARTCRTQDEVAIDVRSADATETPHWLHLRFFNRFRDPAIHGIIVTIRSLTDDAVVSHRLRDYADHALAGQIIAAQEQERTRMSRELEDNVGQVLTVVRSLLEQVQQAAGGLQRGLKPPALDDLGLVEAIRAHCAELSRPGSEIMVDSQLAPGYRLPGNIEVTAYRIVHEGLSIVVPPSGAAPAAISVSLRGTTLVIVLEGPRNPGHARSLDRGPLIVLQERAELVGGRVTIKRLEGDVVRVIVELPVAGPPDVHQTRS